MEESQVQLIAANHVYSMAEAGLLVDSKHGGLLVGPSTEYGGIPTILSAPDSFARGYVVEGNMYLVNAFAAARFFEILLGLNDVSDITHPNYGRPFKSASCPTIIDCTLPIGSMHPFVRPKVLLLDTEYPPFLVNKYSTWRHFELLEWMNTVEPWRS